ncbi:SDR family oxidoreductase [Roseibium aggregatum]|uniref:SDR family oxidoreductase n=1 Tax=Roseibium aggregatum TaxID=187304 RepID=A0A926P3Y1_9HYPH|nr:SDR family oxidoreductase [Roseibium aggregatum]MBD1549765.1 SDR family oxidoreductase [Roseibium aggregatum]
MPKPNDHVFIVGGTSGLGLAVAEAAHALGCKVTIAGRGADRATEAARRIGPDLRGVHLDLEDSASIEAALSGEDPIDHLVLTPIHPDNQTIRTFDAEVAIRAVRIKIVGYLEAVHHALPRLQPASTVTLFGGLAKANPYPGSTLVSTLNGAITGMTATLAVELAPIRVNGISPCLVEDSPRWQKRIADGAGQAVDLFRAHSPAKRLATVEDIVSGVFFRKREAAAVQLL